MIGWGKIFNQSECFKMSLAYNMFIGSGPRVPDELPPLFLSEEFVGWF